MNTATKIISAAAVALMAVAGAAHAEEYNGVLTVNSQRSRTEVQADATAAAKAGVNLYGDAAQAGVTQVAGNVDRNAIRAQAVAASHDPTWNLDRKAFVNSTIPSQYTNGSLAVRRQATQNQAAL
ncbi:hypothetical protein [Variovorax sp. OV329]|uniref:hypothetical protein n=1 Tax=Variovorax sp. OV329 TaxID=1882825 RepID=UPI0008E9543A|nr:hypothetical protein [Variovorax sp. OV329]SFN32076.1 hypothetical protein SAMN05444747_12191 [Variovorax sp. OV329]